MSFFFPTGVSSFNFQMLTTSKQNRYPNRSQQHQEFQSGLPYKCCSGLMFITMLRWELVDPSTAIQKVQLDFLWITS